HEVSPSWSTPPAVSAARGQLLLSRSYTEGKTLTSTVNLLVDPFNGFMRIGRGRLVALDLVDQLDHKIAVASRQLPEVHRNRHSDLTARVQINCVVVSTGRG